MDLLNVSRTGLRDNRTPTNVDPNKLLSSSLFSFLRCLKYISENISLCSIAFHSLYSCRQLYRTVGISLMQNFLGIRKNTFSCLALDNEIKCYIELKCHKICFMKKDRRNFFMCIWIKLSWMLSLTVLINRLIQ